MTIPIGFDQTSGTLVIVGNGVFPARTLRASTSPLMPDHIQIGGLSGRGEQSVLWSDVTSLDGSYTPQSMADALAYLQGEFARSSAVAFEYIQPVASLSWTIPHKLGFRPAVSVVDSAGDNCLADLAWPDAATVIVTFGAPTSGTAYLS